MLGDRAKPNTPLLELLTDQLEISAAAWDFCAARDATRRSHLLELLARLSMEQFGKSLYRSLSAWLESTAL